MCIRKSIVDAPLSKEGLIDTTSVVSLKQGVVPISFVSQRQKESIEQIRTVFFDKIKGNNYEDTSPTIAGSNVIPGEVFVESLEKNSTINAFCSGGAPLLCAQKRELPSTHMALTLPHSECSNAYWEDASNPGGGDAASSPFAVRSTTDLILSSNKDCLFQLVQVKIGTKYKDKLFDEITVAIKKIRSFEEFVRYPFEIWDDRSENKEEYLDFLSCYSFFMQEALQLSVWPLFHCISLNTEDRTLTAVFQENAALGNYFINVVSFLEKSRKVLFEKDWFQLSLGALFKSVLAQDSIFLSETYCLTDPQCSCCYTISFILDYIEKNIDSHETIGSLCSDGEQIKNMLHFFFQVSPMIYGTESIYQWYHQSFTNIKNIPEHALLKKTVAKSCGWLNTHIQKMLREKSKKLRKIRLYELQLAIKKSVRQVSILHAQLKNFMEKGRVDEQVEKRIKELKDSIRVVIRKFGAIDKEEKMNVDYIKYFLTGFFEKIMLFFKKIWCKFFGTVQKNTFFSFIGLSRYLDFLGEHKKLYGLKLFLEKGFPDFFLKLKKDIFKKSNYMRRGILYYTEDPPSSDCNNNPFWAPFSLSESVFSEKTITGHIPGVPKNELMREISVLIASRSWDALRKRIVVNKKHKRVTGEISWLYQQEPDGLTLVEHIALENPSFFRVHIKNILDFSALKIHVLLKHVVDRGNESLLECILSYIGINLFFSNGKNAWLEKIIRGILCRKFWGAAYFFLVAVKSHQCLFLDFVLLKRVFLFAQDMLKRPDLECHELKNFVMCLNDFLEERPNKKEFLSQLNTELEMILIEGKTQKLKDFASREKYYFYYQSLPVASDHDGGFDTPLLRSVSAAVLAQNKEMLEVLLQLAGYRITIQYLWRNGSYLSLYDIAMLMPDDSTMKKYIVEHTAWRKFHTEHLSSSICTRTHNVFYNALSLHNASQVSSRMISLRSVVFLSPATKEIVLFIANQNWLAIKEKIHHSKESSARLDWLYCSPLYPITLIERIAEENPVFFRSNLKLILENCDDIILLFQNILEHNNEVLLEYILTYLGSDLMLHCSQVDTLGLLTVQLLQRKWRGAMYALLIALKSYLMDSKDTNFFHQTKYYREIISNSLTTDSEDLYLKDLDSILHGKSDELQQITILDEELNTILRENNIKELSNFILREDFYFYYTFSSRDKNNGSQLKTPLMRAATRAIEQQNLKMLKKLYQLAGVRLRLYTPDDQGGYTNLWNTAMAMPDDSPIKAYVMHWSFWKKFHTQDESAVYSVQPYIPQNVDHIAGELPRDFLRSQQHDSSRLHMGCPDMDRIFFAVSKEQDAQLLQTLQSRSEVSGFLSWGYVDAQDNCCLLEKIFLYRPFFFKEYIDFLVNEIIISGQLKFIVLSALNNKNVTLIDFLCEANMRWLPFIKLEENVTLFSEVLRRGFWDLAFQFLKTTIVMNVGSLHNRERYKILADYAAVLSKNVQGDALDSLNAFMIHFRKIHYIGNSWGVAFPFYVDGQQAKLYSAVIVNDIKTIQSYLVQGYYPNYMGVACGYSGSMTVWAVERGNLAILKMIRSWMPSLGFYCKRKSGRAPQNLLEIAVEEGHFHILKYLYDEPCFTPFHKTFLEKYSGKSKKINNFLKKKRNVGVFPE